MLEKKALNFPLWVEAILVIVLLVMAVIEFMHGQWFWSAIFGLGGLSFGISASSRFAKGDNHDRS